MLSFCRMDKLLPLRTKRLLLREFTAEDEPALFYLLRDERANTFLPWYPARNVADAETFLRSRFLPENNAFRAAICLQNDDSLIGYACVSPEEAHDFGYGLRSDQWGKGYATEACTAVVRELSSSRRYPFITATHDVLNPQSGRVMQKIGMTYRYSYKELWQPKNIPVVFRMYQLDFADGAETYLGYRDTFPQHWIEKL